MVKEYFGIGSTCYTETGYAVAIAHEPQADIMTFKNIFSAKARGQGAFICLHRETGSTTIGTQKTVHGYELSALFRTPADAQKFYSAMTREVIPAGAKIKDPEIETKQFMRFWKTVQAPAVLIGYEPQAVVFRL